VRETGQGGGRMYHGAKSGAQHRADILALHTAKWQPPPSRQQLEQLAAQTEGWAGVLAQSLQLAEAYQDWGCVFGTVTVQP
jgi:hypothetical protein